MINNLLFSWAIHLPKIFGKIYNCTEHGRLLGLILSSQSRASIPPAEAFKLLDLVGYQEGSVVTKTLLDRSAGTVTLFAFDENQVLSPHSSPYDALVQVLEGEGDFTVSGKANRLTQGDLILLPAGKTHAVKAVQKFKMLLIMVRFHEEKMEFGEKARYSDMTVSS